MTRASSLKKEREKEDTSGVKSGFALENFAPFLISLSQRKKCNLYLARQNGYSFWLVIACPSGSVHCFEADEAGRKPRECKLMFERCTRDRGALWCRSGARCVYVGLVGSSFLYLYRRGNGRGTRLLRTDAESSFSWWLHQGSTLKPRPFLHNELVCIAFIGERDGVYSCSEERIFFLFLTFLVSPSCADILLPFRVLRY